MSEILYLGDSVYVATEVDGLTLFLNNGETAPNGEPFRKNPIFLEPEVAFSLRDYISKKTGWGP